MKSINLTMEDLRFIYEYTLFNYRLPSKFAAYDKIEYLTDILGFLIDDETFEISTGYKKKLKKFKSEFLAQKREQKLNELLND